MQKKFYAFSPYTTHPLELMLASLLLNKTFHSSDCYQTHGKAKEHHKQHVNADEKLWKREKSLCFFHHEGSWLPKLVLWEKRQQTMRNKIHTTSSYLFPVVSPFLRFLLATFFVFWLLFEDFYRKTILLPFTSKLSLNFHLNLTTMTQKSSLANLSSLINFSKNPYP